MLTVVYLFFTVPSSGDVSNSFLFGTFIVEAYAVNNGGISAELGFENSFSFFLVWLVLSVISFLSLRRRQPESSKIWPLASDSLTWRANLSASRKSLVSGRRENQV